MNKCILTHNAMPQLQWIHNNPEIHNPLLAYPRPHVQLRQLVHEPLNLHPAQHHLKLLHEDLQQQQSGRGQILMSFVVGQVQHQQLEEFAGGRLL
jgi:hypothetical protein